MTSQYTAAREFAARSATAESTGAARATAKRRKAADKAAVDDSLLQLDRSARRLMPTPGRGHATRHRSVVHPWWACHQTQGLISLNTRSRRLSQGAWTSTFGECTVADKLEI